MGNGWWDVAQNLGLTGPVIAFVLGLFLGGLTIHKFHLDVHAKRDREIDRIAADRDFYRNELVHKLLGISLPSSESSEYDKERRPSSSASKTPATKSDKRVP